MRVLCTQCFKVCDVTHSESRTYKDARWDLNDAEELVSISTPDSDVANIAHLYTRRQGEYDSFSVKAAAKWKCSRAIYRVWEKNNNVNKALLLNHLKFTELYIYKLTAS